MLPRLHPVLWILVAGLAASACTGPTRTDSHESPFPGAYQRVVTPEIVLKNANGESISHPFFGGFNTPRPQFVDVDGDGDDDLFVQEKSGRIVFFEHVTEGDSSRLVWRTDHYQGLDVGEWFRFADLDQDGKVDLLAEEQYSHVRAYRNVGTESRPDFELFVDTLRTPEGEAIFSDRQNIPNVSDIDCDDDLDLFLGRLDGTITRYEAAGDTAGMPRFAHVTDNFEGIEIVNQQIGVRHGANTLTFADVDGDDALDLFWGDFFEPGLLLIRNRGSCSNPILSTQPEPFPPNDPLQTSGYNAPTLTDWTGNGHLDLFVGVLGGSQDANSSLADNLYFYENTGDGYQLQSRQFVGGLDVGSESKVALGDLDADGTTDLLVSNKVDPQQGGTSTVTRFRGTQSTPDPVYRQDGTLDLPSTFHYAPALADFTGDGSDDLLLGTWKGRVAYLRNTGDGTFEVVDDAIVELPSGSHSVPALGDLTGNGRPDLVVGSANGRLHVYENTGSDGTPEFERRPDLLDDVRVDNRASPALHDVDGDGTLDLLVGAEGGLYLASNEGTPADPSFSDASAVSIDGIPTLASPAVGDLNGDSRAELVMGAERGGLVLMQPSPQD